MAHLHFRRTVYKAGGQKAAARLEYISGRKIATHDHAGAQIAYISNGREDLVAEGTHNLPAWARTAHEFFAAAEAYERQSPNDEQRRGVAFEEFKITLPRELSREQNLVVVKDLIGVIAGEHLPCTWAFHEPLTLRSQIPQPHIHLLISGRMSGSTDEYQRPIAMHFKRWNAQEPGRGGAQKDARMNHQGAVYAHRLMISDVLNIHLEQHGLVARIHPASLESRGIEREPEPKLAPSESQQYREEGTISKTMGAVLAIREARAKAGPGEQNNARQYWEQRKAFLGLTRDMPREVQVARLVALREGRPVPTMQRSQPRVQTAECSAAELDKRWSTPIIGNQRSKIYHLPTHKNYGDVGPHNQVKFWTEREAINAGYRKARNEYGVGSEVAMVSTPWPGHGPRQSSTVARALRGVGLRVGRGAEEPQGRGKRLRVRLQDEERGMGY